MIQSPISGPEINLIRKSIDEFFCLRLFLTNVIVKIFLEIKDEIVGIDFAVRTFIFGIVFFLSFDATTIMVLLATIVVLLATIILLLAT